MTFRPALLLCAVLAILASAAATGGHRKPRQGDPCHLRRYACADRQFFCNGGVLQACPAGTTCVTQYGKNVLKVSPCVTRSSHRGLLGSKSHKPQPKPTPKHTTTPSCRHVGDYVCLPPSAHQKASTRYCQAGISRPCPAGTVCRTQPPHRRQSASPCVWP